MTFWKPFGVASVMICWLSNGEGPLGVCGGGEGVSITNRLLLGGRLRNKNLAGRGSPKKWRVYQKIAQPPPPPPPQLINNDRSPKTKDTHREKRKWANSWDMALFLLRKLNLQTGILSHPSTARCLIFCRTLCLFHTLCVRTAKALARLRGCTGSPEPSLIAYVIRTMISWAGSNSFFFFFWFTGGACLFGGSFLSATDAGK